MGDWTTGRGYCRDASSGRPTVSRADQARMEAEASKRAKASPERKRTGRRRGFKPRADRGWYEGYQPYTSGLEEVHAKVAEIQAAIKIWEDSVPRNRHERRKRLAVLRDLHHEIDRIKR